MAKRFKKGSIEAKRFMAKIRLKKGKPKATKKSLGAKDKTKQAKYQIEFINENGYNIKRWVTKEQLALLSPVINLTILQEPKATKKTLGAKSNKKDKVYIEFLNKKKNFKKDIKNFNSYSEALNYGKNNFDNFRPDMIKYKNYNYIYQPSN